MSDQPRTVRHNESKVLERLARGEPLLSLGIRNARTAEIIRIASTAGFSIVWIDLEHSSISIDCAVQNIQHGYAVTTMLRYHTGVIYEV